MHEATFRGRETEAKALGQTWRFSRWTLNVLDEFLDWARTQLPDPLEVAEKAIFRLQREARRIRESKEYDDGEKQFLLSTNAQQQSLWADKAMDEATSYLGMGSPQFQSLLNSARGAARLAMLLLRKHHPDIDEETAFAIASEVGDDMQRIMSITAGKASPESLGNSEAPAATGAA